MSTPTAPRAEAPDMISITSALIAYVVKHFEADVRGPIEPFKNVTDEVYDSFCDRLPYENPLVDHKVRIEWDSETEELRLHRPGPVHDETAWGLLELIKDKITLAIDSEQRLQDLHLVYKMKINSPFYAVRAEMIANGCIVCGGSDGYYPSFILVIADAQDEAKLPIRADQWYANTEYQAKTIMTMSIDYWNETKCGEMETQSVINAETGKPGPRRECSYKVYKETTKGNQLHSPLDKTIFYSSRVPDTDTTVPGLRLSDFFPDDAFPVDYPNPPILISHEELRRIVTEAEKRARVLRRLALSARTRPPSSYPKIIPTKRSQKLAKEEEQKEKENKEKFQEMRNELEEEVPNVDE